MDEVTKVLFIGLHRPYRSPSQRYRIEQFLPYLNAAKIEYDYSYILNARKDKVFYAKGKYLGKLWIVVSGFIKRLSEIYFRAQKYDYIFVQRESFMVGNDFFERQYAKKSKLIFDFDDAIWNMNVSQKNQNLAFLKNPNKTEKIIKNAFAVVVGNQFLKDYALKYNNNVVLIPTVVDIHKYKREHPLEQKQDGRVCIGWSGSPTTIEHFKILLPVFKKLKHTFGDKIYFKVIGSEDFEFEELNIIGIPWTPVSEIKQLEEIDIGVMPITEDEWSQGKCGLKGLIYMAMEIPNVMTNFGVNSSIIEQNVNGYLCSSEDEWFKTLSNLITNPELRKTIGKAGCNTVHKKFSVQVYKNNFLSLFFHQQKSTTDITLQ